MKLGILVAVAVLIAATASAAPVSSRRPEKEDVVKISSMPAFNRQGGEDIGSAVAIPALPFSDAGTTVGYADDYDEACPYTGSLSPDVVYSYLAPMDMCISVDLCNSFYDTKVYVYENDPSTLIACNDDNFDCVEPPVEYTSWIPEAALTGGNTYYIVVDGYGGDSGDYVMEVTEVDCTPPQCEVECPPEGIDEGEGPCYDGYVDDYNGGCNSYPEAYVYPAPSTETITYCGLGGTFDNNATRDTDWYWLDLTDATTEITICVEAEFNVILGFVDMSPGCDLIYELDFYVEADACEPACLTEVLPAGPWCVFVANSDWGDWPCDSEYVLTIDGYEPEPTMGALDIKPESCPNAFNVKAQGQLPVAVLGTALFDATLIDVSTLSLECPDGSAEPIWHRFGDVATPVGAGADPCECTEAGPDGYTDLKLKFLRQDITAVLGDVENGEEVELTLTGQMTDGTPFEVSDCVWIVGGAKGPEDATDAPIGNPAARESAEPLSWGTIKALYR